MTISLNENIKVREISAEDTFNLRREVLRPGKPIKECQFDGDFAGDTIHLGVFVQNKLTGVASFMKNSNPLFSPKNQFQLRGMAIAQDFKQKGLGAQLLMEGEIKINTHPDTLLWFNARVQAIEFYRKFEYATKGKEFDIPGVCKHVVMYKRLGDH